VLRLEGELPPPPLILSASLSELRVTFFCKLHFPRLHSEAGVILGGKKTTYSNSTASKERRREVGRGGGGGRGRGGGGGGRGGGGGGE